MVESDANAPQKWGEFGARRERGFPSIVIGKLGESDPNAHQKWVDHARKTQPTGVYQIRKVLAAALLPAGVAPTPGGRAVQQAVDAAGMLPRRRRQRSVGREVV